MEAAKRKANRLKNYDYSRPGAYFVTICTQDKRCILCEIVGDGSPVPKDPGLIAEAAIRRIHEKYPAVHTDRFVVMPNHIHLLLSFDGGTGDPSPTLGDVIAWFKYTATKEINREAGVSGQRVFQRSFHDHIIRSEADYQKIWEYIEDNPRRWAEDCYYEA